MMKRSYKHTKANKVFIKVLAKSASILVTDMRTNSVFGEEGCVFVCDQGTVFVLLDESFDDLLLISPIQITRYLKPF